MKSYFHILCIVACAVFMVSCNDEIKFHQFKMDHLNLGDTKYLALATGQSNGAKADGSSQQYLYSIDEGNKFVQIRQNLYICEYEFNGTSDIRSAL